MINFLDLYVRRDRHNGDKFPAGGYQCDRAAGHDHVCTHDNDHQRQQEYEKANGQLDPVEPRRKESKQTRAWARLEVNFYIPPMTWRGLRRF